MDSSFLIPSSVRATPALASWLITKIRPILIRPGTGALGWLSICSLVCDPPNPKPGRYLRGTRSVYQSVLFFRVWSCFTLVWITAPKQGSLAILASSHSHPSQTMWLIQLALDAQYFLASFCLCLHVMVFLNPVTSVGTCKCFRPVVSVRN